MLTTSPACLPRSTAANERLHALVPGGAHTYNKGDDQYPEGLAPVISHGLGSHVWDIDGHEYVEYGSGSRSVVLGHAHRRVLDAVRLQLEAGANFARPSELELRAAERFLACVPTAEMVKFAKNGSDVTTAAVRLARAVTGRPLVAVCQDHPFFSTDDWFIATTPMTSGIPGPIAQLTVTFPYGDLEATESMLRQHDQQVACLILEPVTHVRPPIGYLSRLRELAHRFGALLIFDEMITGFRLSEAGAQGRFGVTPDLSTFGKAMGNGFSVSALAGKREFMERGGVHHPHERVFLLSTTHGAETHSLAAAMAVMDVFTEEGISQQLTEIGERLATGVREIATAAGLSDHVVVRGHPANLVFATLDEAMRPSQDYRTLFMRHLLLNGVLGPSFVVSSAISDSDIDRTLHAVMQACVPYRQALDARDPTAHTGGRSVKPVFRRYA